MNLITIAIFIVLPIIIVTEPTNEFVTLVSQPYYVDKSYLVYEFLHHRNEHNFITCPRQFGKTVNLKMLKTFYQAEVNSSGFIVPYNQTTAYEIFKPSKLFANHPEIIHDHMARYPVLFFDFKADITKTTTRPEVLKLLNEKISQAFSEYSFMRNVDLEDISECSTVPDIENLIDGTLNEHELKYSILSFSIMLQKYFKTQVIILVDDYDYAFANAVSDYSHIHDQKNVIHRYYDLINVMLGLALNHDKKIIDFALLTGVGGKIFTENDPFNTLTYRHFLDDEHFFTPYFGFDKTEIEDLLHKYNCTKQDRSSISKYYKGYYTKKRHTLMYNPYSIVKYLQSKKYGKPGTASGYWVQQETSKFISLVLQEPEFRLQLKAVVEGRDYIELSDDKPRKGAIFETFYTNILLWGVPVEAANMEDLFQYFFDLGYLSYKAKESKLLCVPNKEISDYLKSKLQDDIETATSGSESE